jgi:AraC-like DNA-binding protein
MDILSEVLRIVRLSGAIHYCGEFTEPWSYLTSDPQTAAARLKVPVGSLIPFHVCVEGNCWVTSGGLEPIRIETGGVFIFPRGDQHVMASELNLAPVSVSKIYQHSTGERPILVKYGGGGAPARFLCGYLQSYQQFDPLLRSLPSMLCVHARNGELLLETVDQAGRHAQPIDNAREAEWWQASVRYLISETEEPGPGNQAVVARLAESLFVEVLRWRFRYSEQEQGWLGGLSDPQIGRVLNLLHAQPNRHWTVDELAAEVAMSRAALAKRFVALVGQSPIQYLAEWRMHLARHLLQESAYGIGEIAGRVGYESEATFNRAFRRLVGSPPATWRQSRSALPAKAQEQPVFVLNGGRAASNSR